MKARVLLLGMLLVAAAVLVAIWTLSAPPASTGGTPSAPASTDATSAVLSAGARDEPREPERPIASAKTAFEPLRELNESIRLLVVDREADAPVPEAIVHMLASDAQDPNHSAAVDAWYTGDAEAFLTAHGRALAADGDGELSFPRGAGSWLVCARKGDLFGRRLISRGELGRQRIELERDHDLRIVAVDAHEAPCAGVIFTVRSSEVNASVLSLRTDDQGKLVLHDVIALLRAHSLSEVRTFEACAEVPVVPRPTQRFDLRALPDDPVVFHLPDLGSLRVTLVGADELPASQAGTLSLRPVSDPIQPEKAGDSRFWVHVETTGSWPVLVPVPLGSEYELVADTAGGAASGRCKGPMTRGEIVPAPLTLDSRQFVAIGRLLDETGAPLRSAPLDIDAYWFRDGQIQNRNGIQSRTDESGAFALRTHGTLWIHAPKEGHADRGCVLDLQSLPTFGRRNVGDVSVGTLPTLVRGRVIDEQGAAVPGAYVRLVRKAPGGPFALTTMLASVGPTPSDGTFSFQAPCDRGPLLLAAGEDSGMYRQLDGDDSFTCDGGPVERIVRLEALGGIAGTALFESADAKNQIELRLSDQGQRVAAGSVHDGGIFDFQLLGVPAGTHALVIARVGDLRTGLGPELQRVENIEVRGGGITHDPRLDPLDLRALLRVPRVDETSVAIVDEGGAAIPWGDACMWNEKAEGRDRRPWGAGRLRVPLLEGGWIGVWAPGRRVSFQRIADLGDSLVLRAEYQVVLDLPDLRALQGPSLRTAVRLTPTGQDKRSQDVRSTMGELILSALVDESGEARFRTKLAGKYEVSVQALVLSDSGVDVDNLRLSAKGDASRIEVLDVDGVQSFRTPIVPEDLERLKAAVRDRRR